MLNIRIILLFQGIFPSYVLADKQFGSYPGKSQAITCRANYNRR